jgi:hypothetical protein
MLGHLNNGLKLTNTDLQHQPELDKWQSLKIKAEVKVNTLWKCLVKFMQVWVLQNCVSEMRGWKGARQGEEEGREAKGGLGRVIGECGLSNMCSAPLFMVAE